MERPETIPTAAAEKRETKTVVKTGAKVLHRRQKALVGHTPISVVSLLGTACCCHVPNGNDSSGELALLLINVDWTGCVSAFLWAFSEVSLLLGDR